MGGGKKKGASSTPSPDSTPTLTLHDTSMDALAGKPTFTLADVASAAALSPSAPPSPGSEEPPPPVSPRMLFLPVRTAIAVSTTTKTGKPLPTELFEAHVTSPSGASRLASLSRAPDGRLHLTYHPTESGAHTLQLMFRGSPVGPARPLPVRPGVPQRRQWARVCEAERDSLLAWLTRRLRAAGRRGPAE